MKLKVSPDLTLDATFVTRTQGILAQKRVGKSYKAQVEAEELLRHRQQVVVLDPTDVWWGLRSSADGKSVGFPINILGGRHGDLPLDPASGKQWAKAVVRERFSVVFSLKLMSGPERHRFAADFLETLLSENVDAMHLFIDEADIFAPQVPRSKEQTRCLTATDEIVRRGGVDGIGITLITQRSAVINKDVISQVDMLIVLRMHHDLDIEPVSRWIKGKVNKDLAKEMVATLHKLPTGDAWVFVPEVETFKKVRFRDKITFDSGRTPKAGERRRAPKVLAPVDLEKIGKTIQQTIQEAKDNDPKQLKMRIVKLDSENRTLAAQLANARTSTTSAATKPARPIKEKVVEVKQNVINPKQLTRIEALLTRGGVLIERWDDRSANAHASLEAVHEQNDGLFKMLVPMLKEIRLAVAAYRIPAPVMPVPRPASGNNSSLNGQGVDVHGRPAKPAPRSTSGDKTSGLQRTNGVHVAKTKTGPRHLGGHSEAVPAGGLNDAQQRIIDSIYVAQQLTGEHPRKDQVALYARCSPTSGGYAGNLGILRRLGLIDYPGQGTVSLTSLGATRVSDGVEVPRTNSEIHTFVRKLVGEGAWKIMDVLISEHPNAIVKPELAERAGVSPTSGGFAGHLGELRKHGFLDYPTGGQVRAEDILFIGGVS